MFGGLIKEHITRLEIVSRIWSRGVTICALDGRCDWSESEPRATQTGQGRSYQDIWLQSRSRRRHGSKQLKIRDSGRLESAPSEI